MIADGALIADSYRVLGKLGQGGMGQVYLAEHVRMGRKSAVKIMNPGMAHDPDAVSRFNREAENACRINHTNVASVYDFGETDDGLLFLAMEYVDGEPLSAIINRDGALGLNRATSIAKQVAAALRVAHHLGIVHRDLKPDNIMITRDIDGSELVKVVDFGIAKAMKNEGQNMTRTGLSVGTPEYMSPEQLAGENVDARSDIYSLGLVTFAMLTGQLPFPAVTTRETLVARLIEKPATLASVRSDIQWPSGLQRVMDRVLATITAERYGDAAEFAKELLAARDTPLKPPSGVDPSARTQLAGQMSGPRPVPIRISATTAATQLTPTPGRPIATPVMPAFATPAPMRGRSRLWPVLVGGLLVLAVVSLVTQRNRLVRLAGGGRPVRRAAPAAAGARPPAAATTPSSPPAPPSLPAVRRSAAGTRMAPMTIVADDLAVVRSAIANGERDRFQNAYRKGAAVISQLNAEHPYDPRVRLLRTEMIDLRDSMRLACRRNPAPCEAVGLAVPQQRVRQPLRNRAP